MHTNGIVSDVYLQLRPVNHELLGFRDQVPEETFRISYLEHKTKNWDAEQDQLPYWPTGISSGNRQETGNRMFRPRHTP